MRTDVKPGIRSVDQLQSAQDLVIGGKLKGADPSGILWDSYLAALSVNNAMQRIVVLPPNSPPAAMDALRTAIRAMQKDPVYLEESTKAFGYVPEYVAEADTNQQVRKALHVDPDVTAFMRKFITTH